MSGDTLHARVVQIDDQVGSPQHGEGAQHAEHVVTIVVVEEDALVVHGPRLLGRPEGVVKIVFAVDPDSSTPGCQHDQAVYNSYPCEVGVPAAVGELVFQPDLVEQSKEKTED